MYPLELVKPMAAELNQLGVESLTSPEAVENLLENDEGTLYPMAKRQPLRRVRVDSLSLTQF